jgi:hypothetical protein
VFGLPGPRCPKALVPRFSILAHQLRRRIPSCSSLFRRALLIYSTAPPEGPLVVRPAWPGAPETPDPKTGNLSGPKPPDVPRPFLGQPLLRPASLTEIPRNSRSRVALEKIDSSGASSRLAPLPFPKKLQQYLPAEIGPLVTCRIFRSVAGSSDEAGTAVPITCSLCTPLPSRGSKIFGNKPVDNGDIGSNRPNVVEMLDSRPAALPLQRAQPTSAKCLNRLHHRPNPLTCRD